MMTIPCKTGGGRPIPVFGLGTWRMGGDFNRNPANDDARDIAAIVRALDAGITHIDTAEIYAAGHAETLVGRAIAGRRRPDLFLASKVSGAHLRHDDVLRAAEGSLRRLGTDYLDLYYIHKPNPEIPLQETMRAMNRLAAEGVIRQIGISNFSPERARAAAGLAARPLAASQAHYNLIFREPERAGLLGFCAGRGILTVAWRPVQKGLLIGQAPPLLIEIARKYGATPAQIAINWLIAQPNVATLSTMRTPAHLAENLGALHFIMAEEDHARLAREYPGQQARSDAVPLQ